MNTQFTSASRPESPSSAAEPTPSWAGPMKAPAQVTAPRPAAGRARFADLVRKNVVGPNLPKTPIEGAYSDEKPGRPTQPGATEPDKGSPRERGKPH